MVPDLTDHAGADDAVIFADIDPALITASKQTFDYLHERRPELYG